MIILLRLALESSQTLCKRIDSTLSISGVESNHQINELTNVSLKNKVAIVTGASQGIGKEISHQVAKNGANVICISRNEKALKSVIGCKKFKGEGSYAICDVTNTNLQKIVEEIILNHSKMIY